MGQYPSIILVALMVIAVGCSDGDGKYTSRKSGFQLKLKTTRKLDSSNYNSSPNIEVEAFANKTQTFSYKEFDEVLAKLKSVKWNVQGDIRHEMEVIGLNKNGKSFRMEISQFKDSSEAAMRRTLLVLVKDVEKPEDDSPMKITGNITSTFLMNWAKQSYEGMTDDDSGK